MPEQSLERFEFGPFLLDPVEHRLLRRGDPVPLTPKVFDLLVLLVRNHHHLLQKEELLQAVWGDAFVEEGNLTHAISVLRRALSDDQNGNRLIETVPKKGYRFVADVRSPLAHDVAAPPRSAPYRPPGSVRSDRPARSSGSRRMQAAVILLTAALVCTAWAVSLHRNQPAARAAPAAAVQRRLVLAVLPFEYVPDGTPQSEEYLADGLTGELISQISRMNPSRIGVIGRASASRYKGRVAPVRQVANELGADYLLLGRLTVDAQRVHLGMQLVDATTEKRVWSAQYDRSRQDLAEVQTEAVTAAAREILHAVDAVPVPSQPRPSVDARAYEAYLQGRYYWSRRRPDSIRKSIELFQRAIRSDPGFAPAYAGLADAYNMLDWTDVLPEDHYPKAVAAARQALQVDPTLAEAYASMGYAFFRMRRVAAGEQALARALELNANYATAHHFYSGLLLATGRADEALVENDEALRLDPFSIPNNLFRAYIFIGLRRYADADRQLTRAMALEPGFAAHHKVLARVYRLMGRQQEAWSEALRAATLAGADRDRRLYAAALREYGARGYEASLRRTIEIRQGSLRRGDAYQLAADYAALGDVRRSVQWLDRSARDDESEMAWIVTAPEFDGARSDPAFVSILERLGLRGPSALPAGGAPRAGRPDARR